jgi:hypothetical protein
MIRDGFDDWVRRSAERFDASPEHCASLIDRVMAEVVAPPYRASRHARRPTWAPGFDQGWLGLAAALGRLALPMATAAILGLVVGHSLNSLEENHDFARLLTVSSTGIVDL